MAQLINYSKLNSMIGHANDCPSIHKGVHLRNREQWVDLQAFGKLFSGRMTSTGSANNFRTTLQ